MDNLGEWLPEKLENPSNACKESPNTPVVVDFGSSTTRFGVASQSNPSHSFLTKAARFRDRKSGKLRTVVGNDILLDPSSRSSVRSPFDGPLLTNWDSVEYILDYGLNLLGYEVESPSPIAITEALLLPQMSHRTLQELLFEGYAAPRLAFAADTFAAGFYTTNELQGENASSSIPQSSGKSSLLVYLGSESIHVMPFINGKPELKDTRRIKWGGRLAIEYLHELLVLKYPNFPVPVTSGEVEQLLQKHCFVALDYRSEINKLMQLNQLGKIEVRIQAPLPDDPKATKSAKELELAEQQAQRRKESGRRLQEQAAVARVERQEKQQQQLEQLQVWLNELETLSPENAEAQARVAGFTDMIDVRRTIKQMSNSLKRSRGETIEDVEPVTPLLKVPDEDLDEEQLKEKRRQRLLRASYDARQRAKQAKEAEKLAQEAAAAAEAEWRSRDLRGWATSKRIQLDEVLTIIREREKLNKDPRLRFRQTLLEVDDSHREPSTPKSKRSKQATPRQTTSRQATPRQATPLSTTNQSVAGQQSGTLKDSHLGDASFSSLMSDLKPESRDATSNPDTEIVVNSSAQVPTPVETDYMDDSEPEIERDYDTEANELKALLLEHDPEFTLESLEPKLSWQNSTIHKFLWGERPYDVEDLTQNYQLNLNIERIRAVEPIFQPSMVGIDQAGLSEVCSDLLQRYPQLASSVHVSGGFGQIKGLTERLCADLRRELPASVEVNVTRDKEPELDAWRGLAKLSLDPSIYVSRQEYDENGADYIKPHTWI